MYKNELECISCNAVAGSPMYALVGTSVDLAFAVNTVSQFMSRVGSPHWMAVKCITRYMKGTMDFKLCLEGKTLSSKDFVMRIGWEMQTIGDPPWGMRPLRELK